MKNKKWLIVEHGFTSSAEMTDYKEAKKLVDKLNTKKKGKKTIYIHRFRLIEKPLNNREV